MAKELTSWPDGWTHTAVAKEFRDNGDGSITISEDCAVQSPDGKTYFADRTIRLTKVVEKKAAKSAEANPTSAAPAAPAAPAVAAKV